MIFNKNLKKFKNWKLQLKPTFTGSNVWWQIQGSAPALGNFCVFAWVKHYYEPRSLEKYNDNFWNCVYATYID